MKKITFLAMVALMLSGCATIFTGTKDTIYFDSDPEGATVYLDGLEICRTPCSYRVDREFNSVDIQYKLDGYEARIFTLDQEFNVISVLNLANPLGWAIDMISGSIMRYDRKSYDLELDPDTRAMLMNANEIHIDSKEEKVDFYVYK